MCRGGSIWQISAPSSQLCCESKIALKIFLNNYHNKEVLRRFRGACPGAQAITPHRWSLLPAPLTHPPTHTHTHTELSAVSQAREAGPSHLGPFGVHSGTFNIQRNLCSCCGTISHPI